MASEVETTPVVVNGGSEQEHLNGDAVATNGNVDSSASSTVDDASTSAPSTSSVPVAAAPLPTYDDIFPALPGGLGGPQVMVQQGGPALGGLLASRLGGAGGTGGVRGGTAAPKLRSSNVTKTYRVAAEERRAGSRRFGEQSELGKICTDIMARTGTDIQLTSSKDGTLNFLITGKEEATAQVYILAL